MESAEYSISIRIVFPWEITAVLKREKERFVAEYGSEYKSEPHITLYLDRYTKEGFPKLLRELHKLRVESFTISLLAPEVRREENDRCNLYVVDVSNKEQLQELRDRISKVAIPYQSPLLREKVRRRLEKRGVHTDGTRKSAEAYLGEEKFNPHITLGEIGFDEPQADFATVQKNTKSIEGAKIVVSSIVVFFYGKEWGAEKATLLDEIVMPFNS